MAFSGACHAPYLFLCPSPSRGVKRDMSRVQETVTDPGRSRLHGWLMAIGLAFGVAIAGILVGSILGLFALVGASGSATSRVVSVIVASEVGYLAVGVGYLRGLADGIPLSPPSPRQLAGAAIASVALVVLGQGVLRIVPGAGIEDVSSALGAGAVDPVVLLALAAVSLLLVGPAEEVLFRGAVQGTLRLAFGRWPAILGASVVFTAVHAGALASQPLTTGLTALTVVGLVSVALGYTFDRTGSLAVPILIHGLYNCLLLIGAYVLTTGRL